MFARSCLIILPVLLGAWLGPAAAEPLRIAAVGDIMLAGHYTPIMATQADYPFAATAPILHQAHLAIGNLEAPLTNRGREYRDKRFRFRAKPATAGALQRAGFSVLTLANNHILDYGSTGLADTMRALTGERLLTAGAGSSLAQAREPALLTRAGRRIAVLAYSLTQPTAFFATASGAGTAPAQAQLIAADVRRASQQADVVVVSIHWGGELETRPRPAQRALAHQIIDAGATVVLGHHPHVLQGVEYYGQGIICYSLGNFTFGSRSRSAARGMIALLTIPDAGPPEMEIVPLSVDNRATNFQPRILSGPEAADAIAAIDQLSRPLQVRVIANGPPFRAVPLGGTNAAALYRPTALR